MGDILINDVVKEVNTYLKHNPELISSKINSMMSTLDQHTSPLVKVKGNYPSGHDIMSNVVQGFDDGQFDDLGSLQIEHKILKNFHQKVNFSIKPSQIIHSYWGHLYQEGLSREEMPISKYILEEKLIAQVIDDMATLEVKGVYDPARAKEFGYSMNGIETILLNLFAAVPGDDPTPFKIPLSGLTDTNIVDQVTLFEKQLPSKIKSRVKKIFMSENNLERYIVNYEDRFGDNKFQMDQAKTRLSKLPIVGIPFMETDDIFCTVDNNFVRLIDVFDGKPEITDIQKYDYKLKIFMEFWKGYDFLIDELVFVANFEDAEYGLGSQELNQKFYGFDGVTV